MDSAEAVGRKETPVSLVAVDTVNTVGKAAADKTAVGRFVAVDKLAVGTVVASKVSVDTVVAYRVAVVAEDRFVVAAKSSQRWSAGELSTGEQERAYDWGPGPHEGSQLPFAPNPRWQPDARDYLGVPARLDATLPPCFY